MAENFLTSTINYDLQIPANSKHDKSKKMYSKTLYSQTSENCRKKKILKIFSPMKERLPSPFFLSSLKQTYKCLLGVQGSTRVLQNMGE